MKIHFKNNQFIVVTPHKYSKTVSNNSQKKFKK